MFQEFSQEEQPEYSSLLDYLKNIYRDIRKALNPKYVVDSKGIELLKTEEGDADMSVFPLSLTNITDYFKDHPYIVGGSVIAISCLTAFVGYQCNNIRGKENQ